MGSLVVPVVILPIVVVPVVVILPIIIIVIPTFLFPLILLFIPIVGSKDAIEGESGGLLLIDEGVEWASK